MGQRPTYTFLLMSEREAEPRINHYLGTRQVCIDIHSSAAPCLFPLPQSGFFGSRGLFPKKYPSGVWGETPHYIFFTVGAQYLKLLPAVSESLHRQTFCRLALPFSLPLPGFFGFLGSFFPKKLPKSGRGVKPRIYNSRTVGARGGASHIFLPPWSGHGAEPHKNRPSCRGAGRPAPPIPFSAGRETP